MEIKPLHRETLIELLALREQARDRKNYSLADAVREVLASDYGVEIEDTKTHVRWRVKRDLL